jgi:hypothetical protein
MWVPSDFPDVRGILGKETNLLRQQGIFGKTTISKLKKRMKI